MFQYYSESLKSDNISIYWCNFASRKHSIYLTKLKWIFANRYILEIQGMMSGLRNSMEVCTKFSWFSFDNTTLDFVLLTRNWHHWDVTALADICRRISKYNSGRTSRNLNRNNKKFSEVWFGDWAQVCLVSITTLYTDQTDFTPTSRETLTQKKYFIEFL